MRPCASISKGCRNSGVSLSPFHEQFDTTKSSRRRFSSAGCFANILPNERSHVFDRFYRGTDARRTAAGSGLGLYVARKIALAHGGDLALVDTGGDGVAFRLTLPVSRSEASVAE